MVRARESSRNVRGDRKRKSTSTSTEKALTSSFRKVGITSSGNILVEMTPEAWESLCSREAQSSIDFGAAIREYRLRHKVSQSEFAKMVGHSRNWISMLERDRNVKLSYQSFRKILAIVVK
jgi:DNA-binding XRE family transcriptional regulator